MGRLAASGICVSSTLGLLPGAPILNPVVAANIETVIAARRRLYELGATIVAGTDAGITPAKPHDVLPYAFADLVDAGMTHLEWPPSADEWRRGSLPRRRPQGPARSGLGRRSARRRRRPDRRHRRAPRAGRCLAGRSPPPLTTFRG